MHKTILSYIAVLAVGVGIGTYFDAKHTIEETVVYKDRVKTVVKEVITERPDGTKITERETNKVEKTDKVTAKKESIPVKPNWGVGVKYDLFRPIPIWTAEVQRRVIGDFYVGAYGRTDGVVGVGVSFFF